MNNGELHHGETWRRCRDHKSSRKKHHFAEIRGYTQREWQQWDKHNSDHKSSSTAGSNISDCRTATADEEKHKSQCTKCSSKCPTESWRVSWKSMSWDDSPNFPPVHYISWISSAFLLTVNLSRVLCCEVKWSDYTNIKSTCFLVLVFNAISARKFFATVST